MSFKVAESRVGIVKTCGNPNTGRGANTEARYGLVDPESRRFYSSAMNKKTPEHQFEVELRALEQRLDDLVGVVDTLKEENKSLKQRQDSLTAERSQLLQKNEQVRARVESMINRLKAMEQS
jgi:cell division protein ZapB